MARPRVDSERRRSLEFGELVHLLRRQRRESQGALAAKIPMSAGNLSRIERGLQGPPSDETIRAVAAALDADLGELLRAAGRNPSEESFEQFVRARLTSIAADVATLRTALVREKK